MSEANVHVERRVVRNPWRAVVHIELLTNSRGRDYYWLTLECGHHKYHGIPAFLPIPPLVRIHGDRPPPSRLAPKKCRCLLCGAETHNAELTCRQQPAQEE